MGKVVGGRLARFLSWLTTTSVTVSNGRPTVRVSHIVAENIRQATRSLWFGPARATTKSHSRYQATAGKGVYDWSSDGKWVLASLGMIAGPNRWMEGSGTQRFEVWLLPVPAIGSHEAQEARKIISDPAYDLFQSHFSPDGRWIVFEAVRFSPVESTLYVMPAAGGPWTLISERQALGRQASLVSRWKGDLLHFCPKWLVQCLGNTLRFS